MAVATFSCCVRSRGVTSSPPATIRVLLTHKSGHWPAMICAYAIPEEPEPGILKIEKTAICAVHLTLPEHECHRPPILGSPKTPLNPTRRGGESDAQAARRAILPMLSAAAGVCRRGGELATCREPWPFGRRAWPRACRGRRRQPPLLAVHCPLGFPPSARRSRRGSPRPVACVASPLRAWSG
jgi:hypothetical protein